MRAVTITDDHRLVVADHPDPVPGPGEVLVRVHGAGLNRGDLSQVQGGYPAPPGWPADIPGLEFAGEVAGLGDGVAEWAVGDRVFVGPGTTFLNEMVPGRVDHGPTPRGATVEDDVMIGGGCTILPGVRIGAKSFVAAGTLVTRDVPPRSFVKGRPGVASPLPAHLDRGNSEHLWRQQQDLWHPEARPLAALQEFSRLMQRVQATPRSHVVYRREAWMSPRDISARVTFDRDVRCAPELRPQLRTAVPGAVRVFAPQVILELKFTARMPRWAAELVQCFGLVQSGAAKYVEGVTALGEHRVTSAPALAVPREDPRAVPPWFAPRHGAPA